jgi:hypothetical protein
MRRIVRCISCKTGFAKRLIKILLLTLVITLSQAKAQEYVIDPQRLMAVEENEAVRSVAEGTHNHYLGNIKDKIGDINTNTTAVVLAQRIIYNGLSQVNSALKDGLAVKNMAVISADILNYLDQALAMAKTDPALLLIASRIQGECRKRSIALVTDVSDFVLKPGGNILADYNARDELLRKVVTQLHIIDGLAYGAWRSMYWARQRGIITSLNPFRDYIDQDRAYINQIIQNAKYLK